MLRESRNDPQFRNLVDVPLPFRKREELPERSTLILETADRGTTSLVQSPIDVVAQPVLGDLIDPVIAEISKCPEFNSSDVAVDVLLSSLVLTGEQPRPCIEYSSERWGVDGFTTACSSFQLVVEVLRKTPRFMIVGSSCRLDNEAVSFWNFQSDGPFWILVVSPFVEHDPAVTPEV
jgi:hypothetical protein